MDVDSGQFHASLRCHGFGRPCFRRDAGTGNADPAFCPARGVRSAANKGILTSAQEYTGDYTKPKYFFDSQIYANRVFDSKGVADPGVELIAHVIDELI